MSVIADTAQSIRTFAKVFVVIAVVVVAARVYGYDFNDGARAVVIEVTWRQDPDNDATGRIDAAGQIGREQPFVVESFAPSPFVESGKAYPGEIVQVRAWAVDGPLLDFRCAISGAGVVVQPVVWDGMQVSCRAIVS